MEKAISALEKVHRDGANQLGTLKVFLKTNVAGFISSMKPKLKVLFPKKYANRDGNVQLMKDLRLIKVATGGKIPDTVTVANVEMLIRRGKDKSNFFNTDIEPDVTLSQYPTSTTPSPMTTPSPWYPGMQAGTGSPFFNYWNSPYPFWGSSYPGSNNLPFHASSTITSPPIPVGLPPASSTITSPPIPVGPPPSKPPPPPGDF